MFTLLLMAAASASVVDPDLAHLSQSDLAWNGPIYICPVKVTFEDGSSSETSPFGRLTDTIRGNPELSNVFVERREPFSGGMQGTTYWRTLDTVTRLTQIQMTITYRERTDTHDGLSITTIDKRTMAISTTEYRHTANWPTRIVHRTGTCHLRRRR
jgi:hypothetical protein